MKNFLFKVIRKYNTKIVQSCNFYWQKILLRQKMSLFLQQRNPWAFSYYIFLNYFKPFFFFYVLALLLDGSEWVNFLYKRLHAKLTIIDDFTMPYIFIIIIILMVEGGLIFLQKLDDDFLRKTASSANKNMLLDFEQFLIKEPKYHQQLKFYEQYIINVNLKIYQPLYLLPSNATFFAFVVNKELLFTPHKQVFYEKYMQELKEKISMLEEIENLNTVIETQPNQLKKTTRKML